MHRSWRRASARNFVLAAVMLFAVAGCGDDGESSDDSGDDVTAPPAEISCPTGDFTESFVPPDWTAPFVEVCVTSDRRSVLLKNKSGLMLEVQAGAGSTLRPATYRQPQEFVDAVNAQLASNLTASNPGRTALPPGAFIISDGAVGGAGQVLVGLPRLELAATYAVDKLAAYIENRLTSPGAAYAERVADCASEMSVAWQNLEGEGSLTFLLADTALGAGLSCGGLIQDVVDEAGVARPTTSTLAGELDQFASHVKASVVDDFTRLLRNAVALVK